MVQGDGKEEIPVLMSQFYDLNWHQNWGEAQIDGALYERFGTVL